MVWKCFSYYGVGPIYRSEHTMDVFQYIRILNEIMLPYALEEIWEMQQDNDPKQRCKKAKK